MLPRRTKRKAPPITNGATANKRSRSSLSTSPERVQSIAHSSHDPLRQPHHLHQEAEDNGIVLREFYPHEMSNDRALAYNADELPRPITVLNKALAETASWRRENKVSGAVVHWFKGDLRMNDNRALSAAGAKAKEAGVPLVCLYIVSPQDYQAHLTSPVRVDFILRSLKVLKEDLAALHIPLYVETVEKRKAIPDRIVELMREWGASHLYANIEYEVDELRREAKLVTKLKDHDMTLEVLHDTCVVPPGELHTGAGKQYAVYTPWWRAWVAHIHSNLDLIELSEPPPANSKSARETFSKLFESPISVAPKNKSLSKEEMSRFHDLWPAGEREAMKRLDVFTDEKIGNYSARRNLPQMAGTSSLSVHFSSGTLSARQAVRAARAANSTKKLDGGSEGISVWISEIAWRDFYKHVLVNWPYVCMNKPFKPEYSNITWSYDQDHFKAWCAGQTGYPIVDAAMRQLLHTGWMHNRCRMIVASFLAKDLLIDWRLGEKFFMEHLVDGDFASNNGGWGFSASVGVDPQPYFRIFNPLLQSEKFDPEGEYIRKWVPELEGLDAKAVHAPYNRGAGPKVQKKGYPRPIVEHKGAREKALSAYKEALGH